MERFRHFLAFFLCAAALCASLAGCAQTLNGTYKAETLGTGASYTFDGKNVEMDILVLGVVSATLNGTYEIDGNKITFTFNNTSSEEADTYSGTFDFVENENTIKIGLIEYTKVN